MNIDEVAQWHPFKDPDGNIWDLSFLDAHEVTYTHSSPGKQDIVYKFIVSYSFHCFCKEISLYFNLKISPKKSMKSQ